MRNGEWSLPISGQYLLVRSSSLVSGPLAYCHIALVGSLLSRCMMHIIYGVAHCGGSVR